VLLLQWHHSSVSTIGYDDKSGLLVIAGDGHGGSSSSAQAASSGAVPAAAAAAAALAAEGVSVSVWQLRERQLQLRFALGAPQGGPSLLARAAAGLLGVDSAGSAAVAAARWAVVFSPLLEYVALLTGSGR
jgi:hypothetical protein